LPESSTLRHFTRYLTIFLKYSFSLDIKESLASNDLENKIRRWDELSTGIAGESVPVPLVNRTSMSHSKSDTVHASDRRLKTYDCYHDSLQSEKRDHPWDSSFPARLGKVDIKNTSMESGDGIETTFTTKAGQLGKSLSADTSRVSPVHRMRMDRIGQEMHQINEETVGVSSTNVVATAEDNNDGENRQLTPWHHENTKAMADDFDAAWVSLPSSAFFKSRKVPSSAESSHRDTTFPYGSIGNEVESGPTSQTNYALEKFSAKADSSSSPHTPLKSASHDHPRNIGSSTFESYDKTLKNYDSNVKSKTIEETNAPGGSFQPSPAKVRGLRGFLKRKGSLSRGSMDQGSNNSASLNDYKSFSNANASYDEALKEKHAVQLETIDHGNVTNPTHVVDFRGRRSASKSRSPVRGRAKSLDDRRIRNPSIARKFSRLLRVYDSEKDVAQF
jgi:hypothetical protein